MMESFSSIWGDLKFNNNRFSWSGQLGSSCEAELQELMKQIDIMFENKTREWERDVQTAEAKLEVREKECMMQRVTIEQKHREIGQLRHQVETMERSQRDSVAEYEHQLKNVRSEVGNMKMSYEKLQRKHAKHSKQMEDEKNKARNELRNQLSDLEHLKQTIDEYRIKTKDWDLDKRSLQKQIDGLENQRQTLTNKCELIQQQSLGYQSQLDKRRQLLDNTEYNLKSQITQLEGQLERAKDTIASQESQLEKLRVTLDNSNSSHTRLHEERDQLEKEYHDSKKNILNLEDDIARKNVEMEKMNELWKLSEDEHTRRLGDVERLEQMLADRDKSLRALEAKSQKDYSGAIQKLHDENHHLKQETKNIKKNERKLLEVNEQLRENKESLQINIVELNNKIKRKTDEMKILEETEMKTLKQEISKLRDQYHQKDEYHGAELAGMRQELSNLTTELHQRNIQVATLSERATQIERQAREENEKYEKRAAELGVVNAQLEALRLENQHLRKSALRNIHSNTDMMEAENHLKELQTTYTNNLQKLEKENEQLQEELDILQQKLQLVQNDCHDREEEVLSETDRSIRELRNTEERRLKDLELHYEKRLAALTDRHTATVKQHQDDMNKVLSQKLNVEEELKSKSNLIKRMTGEHAVMSTFVHDVSHIISSPTKTVTEEAPRQDSSFRKDLSFDLEQSTTVVRPGSLDSTDYTPEVKYNRVYQPNQNEQSYVQQKYNRHSSSPMEKQKAALATSRKTPSPVNQFSTPTKHHGTPPDNQFGWKQKVRIVEPCSDKQQFDSSIQKGIDAHNVSRKDSSKTNKYSANNYRQQSTTEHYAAENLRVKLPPQNYRDSDKEKFHRESQVGSPINQQTTRARSPLVEDQRRRSPFLEEHLSRGSPVLRAEEVDVAESTYLSDEIEDQRPFTPESVATKFLQEEQERAKELEKIIDSHIEDLKNETEKTVKKYTR